MDDIIKNYYKELGKNIDIEHNFYYDETNNYRKFKFKENGINIDNFLKEYRLGGITIEKSKDTNQLFLEIYNKLNIKDELKFKQINSGKTDTFINCLKGLNLKILLDFLNENEIFIHTYSFNNVYDTIVEIIDSLLEDFVDISYYLSPIMKNELYLLVESDINRFINILKDSNYPNITNENIQFFCKNMIEWIEEFDNNFMFGLENCRQLFKKYLKKGELLFLKDNKEKVIIDSYCGINYDMCIKFSKSFHYFDEIPELEEEFKKYHLTNYKFIDSKKSIQIQIADVIVGLLNKFFEFIDETEDFKIIKIINDLSTRQNDNLKIFLNVYKKSVEKNEMFMTFYEPEYIVRRRNSIIEKLINAYNN